MGRIVSHQQLGRHNLSPKLVLPVVELAVGQYAMMIEHATPATVEELAAISSNSTTLYFAVGTVDGDELLLFTAANLTTGESLVAIDTSAGCLAELELPERTPAIGAWCSKGTLIGYEYDSAGIANLMDEARRFSAES